MIKVEELSGMFYLDIPYSSSKAREYIKLIRGEDKYNNTFTWDSDNKAWIIKESAYKSLQKLMKHCRDVLKEQVLLSDKALQKLITLENYDERAKWKDDDTLPPLNISGLKTPLRYYQNTCVRFLQDAGGRGIIALGTGVGKTLTALAWTIWQKKKAIIICPSQRGKTKWSWYKEIRKHTGKSVKIMWGNTQMDMMSFINSDYIIVNYELLPKFRSILTILIQTHGFDTIIIDESHSIKNFKTRRTQEVLHIAKLCDHRILLSATAIKNRPQELFTQLHIVAPDRFNSWKDFLSNYCHRKFKDRSTGIIKKGKPSKLQLQNLNKDIGGIYFYRDKLDILSELPPLTIETVTYDLEDNSEYTQVETEVLKGNLPQVAGKQLQHKLLANTMIDNTVELITSSLLTEDNNKIIVYSGFINVVERLGEALGSIAVISHGQLQPKVAEVNFERFNTDDSVKVIVATYQSFSESINLQDVANVVVYNDQPFVSATMMQGIGRISRMGQAKHCYAYVLGFKDTYYDEIFDIIETKHEILTQVLEGREVDSKFLNQTIKPKGGS